MLLVAVTPPPVAVIVTVCVAREAVLDAFSVRVADAWPEEALGITGFALQLAVTPVDNPLMASVTAV